MKLQYALVGLCVSVSLGIAPLFGIIVPALDLVHLCERADIIVVGRTASVSDLGPTTQPVGGTVVPGRSYRAKISILRVIKGQSSGNEILVPLFLPNVYLAYKGVATGQVGVFFLRRGKEGIEIFDPYHPFVAAVPGAPAGQGAVLDQVTAELAYAISSPAASEETRREGIWALEQLRTPASTAALGVAASHPNEAVRLRAMAALLRRNDVSHIAEAVRILLDPGGAKRDGKTNLIRGVAYAIRDGVGDPRSIPDLTRLLTCGDVIVRRAAVDALRRTGVPAAIQPLARALNDSDDQVVWNAIMGLAEITGDLDHGPGLEEEFKGKQREKYVSYWRNWAQSRKQPSE